MVLTGTHFGTDYKDIDLYAFIIIFSNCRFIGLFYFIHGCSGVRKSEITLKMTF